MAWAVAKQYEKLWKHPGVSVDTKEMMCRALVETSLTFGLECMTLSVENMTAIDMANSRLLRYCTRRDRDAYHAHNYGAIPHMSSTCVYNQIMLVGHALRHDSALGRVLLRTERNAEQTRRPDDREIVAAAHHPRCGADPEGRVVPCGAGQGPVCGTFP